MEIGKIKSIELLRKSVMPPLAMGGIGLSVGLILPMVESAWIGALPSSFRALFQFSAFGVAIACLVLLLVRLFFAGLVLRPADVPPIVVRFIPAASAKRFFTLLQRTSTAQWSDIGGQSRDL